MKGVVSVGFGGHGFKGWNAGKPPFPLPAPLLSLGCPFSLKQVDFFHVTGNVNPEIGVSGTKEERCGARF